MADSEKTYFHCLGEEKRELIPMNSKQEIVRWFNSFCEYYDGLYSYEEREEVLDLNVEVLLELCKKYKK